MSPTGSGKKSNCPTKMLKWNIAPATMQVLSVWWCQTKVLYTLEESTRKESLERTVSCLVIPRCACKQGILYSVGYTSVLVRKRGIRQSAGVFVHR